MTVYAPTQPARPNQLETYLRVLHALMLRDMRTRFGGTHLGWSVTVLFPVVHVMVIASIFVFRGVPSPMGDSTLLFCATGVIPVLGFQYISREVMRGVNSNKPLTYYPQVKKLDVMLARVVNEIIGSFATVTIILTILYSLGVNVFPVDPLMALSGYLVALLFGIGMGALNVGIMSVFPGWSMGYMLLCMALYITSGVHFMACFFPEQIYTIMKYNPLLQIVEWVRLGYEPELPAKIDYLYVLMWAATTLGLGLAFERFISRSQAI